MRKPLGENKMNHTGYIYPDYQKDCLYYQRLKKHLAYINNGRQLVMVNMGNNNNNIDNISLYASPHPTRIFLIWEPYNP